MNCAYPDCSSITTAFGWCIFHLSSAEAEQRKPSSCCICGTKGPVVWEHEHSTGKFRGWTCQRCNMIMGIAHDDPVLLKGIAEYLIGRNT